MEELLDESLAVMMIVLFPIARGMDEIDQLVVPIIVPQEEPLLVQVTEETETLSLAVPEIEIVASAVV